MKNIKPLRKSIQSPKIPLGFRRSPTFLTIPSNCKTQGSNKHNNHSQLLAVKYSWAEWEIKLEIDMPNRKEWSLKPEESIPWTWALIAHMTCIGNAQNCYGVVDSIYHRVVSCILYSILYWKTISIQWQASRQNKDLPSQHLRKFHCKWNEKRFILIFCTRSISGVWEGQSVLCWWNPFQRQMFWHFFYFHSPIAEEHPVFLLFTWAIWENSERRWYEFGKPGMRAYATCWQDVIRNRKTLLTDFKI